MFYSNCYLIRLRLLLSFAYWNQFNKDGKILFRPVLHNIMIGYCFFFLPCLSLIKLKKYIVGKLSEMMNKVIYFIFYEKNSAY
jgi:hypothetical protein